MGSGFDVVVVGAGSSGAALAARLSEDESRSVVLLEAGPEYSSAETPPFIRRRSALSQVREDSPYQWGRARVRLAEGQREQPYAQGRGVGGSSAINALAAIRGTPEDYDGWASAGCLGWSWSEVLPAFCRLERDVQFGDHDHHGGAGPVPIFRAPLDEWGSVAVALGESAQDLDYGWADDHNDPTSTGASPLAFNVEDHERVSTNDAYLEPARTRPNLVIRGGAEVGRVVIENGRATGVELVGGEVVAGDEVVLCGGAIQSPAVLMRSGIGPARTLRELDIDVHADRPGVGQNLADHPMANLVLRLRDGCPPGGVYPLACYLRCETGDGDGANNTIIAARNLPSATDGTPLAAMWAKAGVVHSRGRVALRSIDPAVYPLVEFEMLSDRRDLPRLRDATRVMARLLERPAFRAVVDGGFRVVGASLRDGGGAGWQPLDANARDDELDAWLRASCGTIWHPAGTCAMGSAEATGSVVTPDCRVIGIDGLRVVDASIMPTLPRANPNLTCIMLAEHAASRW
ncbi:MAG: GMC family oxidoreductase N-terminal domain-containing protein [Acidimicrobiales bacterium]|nr:GMC family oxidoreductase N-terminal domain-containing protein [Acidimicrobiales bacterium]